MTRKINKKIKRHKVIKHAASPSSNQIALLRQAQQAHVAGDIVSAEKIYRLLTTRNVNLPGAYINLAAILQQSAKWKESIILYKQALVLNPELSEAHNNLGNSWKQLDQYDKAIACFERALRIDPKMVEAHNNLGNTRKCLGQFDEAIICFERALEIHPNFVEAHHNLGNALRNKGHFEAAIACYERALNIDPNLTEAHNDLGNALRGIGQFGKAINCYEKSLSINPNFSEAHFNLSHLKKYEKGDRQLQSMLALLTNKRLSDNDKIFLCFALARATNDLGQYSSSFDYLRQANHLQKQKLNYDINADIKLFSSIKKTFENKAFPISQNVLSSKRPIFIVGMPRSGTSLVEQILASHSMVHGAGELDIIQKLVDSLKIKMTVNTLSNDHLNLIRDGYLEALTELKVPESIITDKMPLNFLWLGHIFSAFPEAKIIHLNRDPRATCWSIYSHYFTKQGNGYAYDFEDLVEFYHLYVNLMSFWRQLFPKNIYDICYEELTENQEVETRRLLEFCDLDWEEKCLSFHETTRVVATASDVQVRKRMYKGSSDAWRRYEEYLQPLIQGLKLNNNC